MRAMDDKIEPSDADKARHVWEEAAVPKCGPLDDKAAETLGKKLDWAACLRGVADSTLPLRERERLKRIELAAIKLACLLAKYPATLDRIEQYWPDFSAASDPPDLQLTRRGLVALWEASGHAQMHRGGAAELRDLFDSPERLFIELLGKIYFECTGRNPNVGHSNYPASSEGPGHSFGGPFVRFVREASRQFCKVSRSLLQKQLGRQLR
jgi:hypothetical protein